MKKVFSMYAESGQFEQGTNHFKIKDDFNQQSILQRESSICSIGYLIIDQFSKGHSVLSNISQPETNIPRTLSRSVHCTVCFLCLSFFALHWCIKDEKTNDCKINCWWEKVILLKTDHAFKVCFEGDLTEFRSVFFLWRMWQFT